MGALDSILPARRERAISSRRGMRAAA